MTSAAVQAALAAPREAGTESARTARAALTDHLRSLGYEVEEQPFQGTAAALLSLPLAGAAVVWVVLLVVPLLLTPVPDAAALVIWLVGAALAGLLAAGPALGWSSFGEPVRQDANLIATRRGAAKVRRWLVAHVDTKAQRHSMAERLVAVWLLVTGALAFTALGVLRLAQGPLAAAAVVPAALTLVAGSALATRGRLRGGAPGTRDNASGVLAVLAAAARVRDPAVGILLTGAEEFGLLGARAWVRAAGAAAARAEFVNVDTVDDTGTVSVVLHHEGARPLAERMRAALAAAGLEARIRKLPLGILTDSLVFARAGAPAVTVARLDWSTLRRLHTPRDEPSGFTGVTIPPVAEALGRLG